MIKKIIGMIKGFKSVFEDAVTTSVTAYKLSRIKKELEGAHKAYDALTARKAAMLTDDKDEAERALAAWKIYKIGCHRFNGYGIFFKDCAGRPLGRYRGEIVDTRIKRCYLMIGNDAVETLIPYNDKSLLAVWEDDASLTFTIASFYQI